jgi:hypothetical protein
MARFVTVKYATILCNRILKHFCAGDKYFVLRIHFFLGVYSHLI